MLKTKPIRATPKRKEVFVFKLRTRDEHSGQVQLIALPREQIRFVESLYGSTAVYCRVNGAEVQYDFEKLVRELGWDTFDVNQDIRS